MPHLNDISIKLSIQQYECKSYSVNEFFGLSTLEFKSTKPTSIVYCPFCGSPNTDIYDLYTTTLKDIPIFVGIEQNVNVTFHRYRCNHCRKSFSEEIGFKYPNTRVTTRAARWIKELLRLHMSIKAVEELSGIHWSTICRIQKEVMDEMLNKRKQELKESGYKPRYLAVDEFAIHKGHTYATCVMDLDEGDIIWVGSGRSMECFDKFFKEIDLDYLSEVKAIAMDMNASYNTLVSRYLPHVDIVYDRYHMQAQYGKDVLGSVRLEEAKEHLTKAKAIDAVISNTTDTKTKRELKKEAKTERTQYTMIKRSRWTLLMNRDNLHSKSTETLTEILNKHDKLATCYAMKEEMCEIFELDDEELAREKWENWFTAAKASEIPQLVKFAELKEARIEGLINHAKHSISTGKLEGLNNKIKVSKRIGYGYRNDDYFFTLIRYLSIPYVKSSTPKKT